ncbi:MAG: hypothetical protein WB699_11270 [Bacteroidota bacterium]
MKTVRKHRIAFIVSGVIAALFVFSGLVMLLWNLLMPQIFGLPLLSYWQGMGLFVLAHVLFKGGPTHNAIHGMKHERWRKMMDERLYGMTTEQRKAFFEEWEERLHHFGKAGESPEKI